MMNFIFLKKTPASFPRMRESISLLKIVIVFFIFSLNIFAAEREEIEKEIEDVKIELQTLQEALHEKLQTESEELKSLLIVENEINELSKNITKLNASIENHEKELQSKNESKIKLEEDIDNRKKVLTEFIKRSYQLKLHHPFKMFLLNQNPNTFTRFIVYSRYIKQYQQQLLLTIIEQSKALKQEIEAIQKEQNTLRTLRAEKENTVLSLQNKKQSLKDWIALLRQDISDDKEALKDTQNREELLNNQLKSIIAATKKNARHSNMHGSGHAHQNSTSGMRFSRARGHLLWPLSKPASTLPDNTYIMKTNDNDPVFAVHEGQVVFADFLRGFGLLIIIDHGEGYMTLYGQAQSLYQKVGDIVKKGQMIAGMGKQGGSQESGLYFEIRKNGKPVSMTGWFK